MSTWIKIGAGVLVAATLFVGGYRYAAALYQSDIDELKAAHALALAEKQKEIVANERKQTEALSQAWDDFESAKAELAKSRADAGSLRIELERVRQLDENRKRQASASQCRDERAAVARCESLLREGVGLLGEGRDVLQRGAAIHDAVIELVK